MVVCQTGIDGCVCTCSVAHIRILPSDYYVQQKKTDTASKASLSLQSWLQMIEDHWRELHSSWLLLQAARELQDKVIAVQDEFVMPTTLRDFS